MKTVALFPGTFDPVTLGHADLIQRATLCCDQLIIAVAESTGKRPLFDLSQRVAMLEALVERPPVSTLDCEISVVSFRGLLVDVARQYHAALVIRGVRHVIDFQYETQLAQMNRQLLPHLETVLLPARAEWSALSSTLVREIISLGGDASAFVPPEVQLRIQDARVELL